MDRKKGVLDILQAAQLLPADCTARFLLVGPEREPGVISEVKSIIASHGLSDRVTVVGPAFGEEKVRLFRNAAMFLLPSHAENFPLSVLEAAASGLPIIATQVGATPEFFREGESARFVSIGDASAIAEAVLFFHRSTDLRTSYGTAARSVFVEKLRRDRIMASMSAVYRHMLGKSEKGLVMAEAAAVSSNSSN